MRPDNCFDVATYERMLAGDLPADQAETVCEHLEKCDRCMQVVRTLPEDALVASMRGRQWPANSVEPAFVRDLAQRVLKQAASRPATPTFIVFSCSDCQNKLKVKPELAGKKVKCPKCTKVVLVPAAADLPDEKTRAPQDAAPDIDAATVPPADAKTVAPMAKEITNLANQPVATQAAEPEPDTSLTDFLAPPEQPDEIGRLGSYRVLKILGAGGMGVVYKAEDPSLKRMVALKAMLPTIAASASAKRRFIREAQAAAAIKHNNIVTIFQVSEDRGIPFLAMEFLKGEPLDERLKRETILPLAETLRIGWEMAEGMAAAHDEGLIHRDIKPANTWLEASPGRKSGESHVKILDFGLARSTADQAHLTQSGAIIGTPAYMSPEQGRGGKLDARCDLWSLGVMLYRMCTGEAPFKGNDTVATLMAVAMENPPPPVQLNPEVPAGLSDLVMKLLEKNPAQRIGSAHEVAEALRELEITLQATQATTAPSATMSKTKRIAVTPEPKRAGSVSDRRNRRTPVLLGFAGGLVAVIAAVIIFFWPTQGGVIRVEINDDDIEVAFPQGGMTFKGKDGQVIKVTPGKKVGLHVKRGELEFDTQEFTLKSGETITLKVEWIKEGKLLVKQGDRVIGEKAVTKVDVPIAQPARSDYALAFSGDKSYVLFPTLKITENVPFTAEAWAVLDQPGDPGRAMDLIANAGYSGFSLGVAHPNHATPDYAGKAWGMNIFSPKDSETKSYAHAWEKARLPRQQLIHLAGVYDGAREIRFYVNGWLQSRAPAQDVRPSQFPLSLAGNREGGSGFIGRVCEVRVSKVARYDDKDFTPAKRWESDKDTIALYLFDEGQGDVLKDSSGHGHDGKIDGAKWVKADGTPIAPTPSTPPPPPEPLTASIIQKFEGHTGQVLGVAMTGNGQRVLTGSADGAAILWDSASGKKIQTFHVLPGTVRSVALSGDGKLVLTGANDRMAILWDAATGNKLKIFKGHTSPVISVALSGDGKRVLTGAADKTAILWDADTGKPIQTFEGHTNVLTGVALSSDGKKVLTGSFDKTAILWDADSGKQLHTFEGHTDQVNGVALSGDGKLVVTGGLDGTTIVWDATSGQKIQTFPAGNDNGHVNCVAMSGDGKYVVTGRSANTAILWEVASGKNIQTFTAHSKQVNSVALSGDGKRVLTVSMNKTPILWEIKAVPSSSTPPPVPQNALLLHKFEGHTFPVASVALSRDGNLALTGGSSDYTAILWNGTIGKKIQTFQDNSNVQAVALSGDGKQVLTGALTAVLWDAASGQKTKIFERLPNTVTSAAMSRDGKLVVTNGAAGNKVTLWDAASAQQLKTFEGHTDLVTGVALSDDGKRVLTGSNDKTAILWDAASGKRIHTFQGHTAQLTSVSLSGDGKLALTGSHDRTAILWDAVSGQKIRTFQDHINVVYAVVLSRDGKRALTGSADTKAILWDAVSGEKILTLGGHNHWVMSVAMSDDGKRVLTGSADKTAILWEIKAAPAPIPTSWFKEVAAKNGEEELAAVKAKLMECNPEFDGKFEGYKIDDAGVITELAFFTDNVTDIAPLRALEGLQTLTLCGSHPNWQDRNGPERRRKAHPHRVGRQDGDLVGDQNLAATACSCQSTSCHNGS